MIHFCVATNQRPLKRQGLYCYLDLRVAIGDLGLRVMYSKTAQVVFVEDRVPPEALCLTWISPPELGSMCLPSQEDLIKPRGRDADPGPSQRGGQNSGGAKPRKDGPSETIFWRPSENCFRGGHLREILGVCKGLYKRNDIGGGTYRGEGGGRKLFSVGVLLVRFCPPPPLFCPPLWRSLVIRCRSRRLAAIFGMLRCRSCTATLAFLQCGCHFDQKLRCSKRKTAVQHCKSCVARKWRFPAAFLRISSSHV